MAIIIAGTNIVVLNVWSKTRKQSNCIVQTWGTILTRFQQLCRAEKLEGNFSSSIKGYVLFFGMRLPPISMFSKRQTYFDDHVH